ncbi:hypothetical protein ACIQU5_18325 [Streptomyces sp. NPDC090306]|uniref:hypothetical protein n=1 Tax=unclassified Streptomyces TaxID=2593676 RepID=UPI0036E8DDB0
MPKTDVFTRPGGPLAAAPGGHLVPAGDGAAHGRGRLAAGPSGERHARVRVAPAGVLA